MLRSKSIWPVFTVCALLLALLTCDVIGRVPRAPHSDESQCPPDIQVDPDLAPFYPARAKAANLGPVHVAITLSVDNTLKISEVSIRSVRLLPKDRGAQFEADFRAAAIQIAKEHMHIKKYCFNSDAPPQAFTWETEIRFYLDPQQRNAPSAGPSSPQP